MAKAETKRRRRKVTTTWYVETLTQFANVVLSGMLDAEEACTQVRLPDGDRVNLWRCREHKQITALKSRRDIKEGANFVIYRQRGSGAITRISFSQLKHRAREKRKAARETRENRQPFLF